jgi:hypothetical protein
LSSKKPSRFPIPTWLLVGGGTAMVVVAMVGLLASPVARYLTRRTLASMRGVQASFLTARIDLLALTYSLENLKLIADGAQPTDPPLLTIGDLRVHLRGRELLRGRLVTSAVVEDAKLAVRLTRDMAGGVPDPGAELRGLPPVQLTQLAIHHSEVLITDATISPSAKIWVHGIDAELKDLATRPDLGSASAPSFKLSATVQRSGKFTASGTLDPLASTPDFEGEFALAALELSELFASIAPRSGLQISRGQVSATGTFKSLEGRLHGKVQSVFSGIEIRPAGGNLIKAAEALLANAKIATIPDRFEASHPLMLDLAWGNPATMWDRLVSRGQEGMLDAISSAIEVKTPPSAKPGPSPRRTGSPDGGPGH